MDPVCPVVAMVYSFSAPCFLSFSLSPSLILVFLLAYKPSLTNKYKNTIRKTPTSAKENPKSKSPIELLPSFFHSFNFWKVYLCLHYSSLPSHLSTLQFGLCFITQLEPNPHNFHVSSLPHHLCPVGHSAITASKPLALCFPETMLFCYSFSWVTMFLSVTFADFSCTQSQMFEFSGFQIVSLTPFWVPNTSKMTCVWGLECVYTD